MTLEELDRFPIKRLHWGCGRYPVPGWINSDRRDDVSLELVGDIRDGLALPDDCMDYIVTIHALPEVPYDALVPVLTELRRVLRPGGVLRISVPNIDNLITAYQRKERSYFLIPDEIAKTVGGKFLTQLIWYGYSRSFFNREFIEELLLKAGFSRVNHCAFQETASAFAAIAELDNREAESLFVEAVK